jgi:hypothetical protein
MPSLAQTQELAVAQKKEVNLLQGYTLCRAKLKSAAVVVEISFLNIGLNFVTPDEVTSRILI